MGAFDEDTAVTPAGPGRWRGEVTRRWHIGDNPNGGYVLAIVLAAVRQAVTHPHPLTVTAHYLSPCAAGPVDIDVEVVKPGRTLSSASARIVQGGRARLLVLATYGDLDAARGPTLTSPVRPELPDPDDCLRRDDPTVAAPRYPGPLPTVMDQVELRVNPQTAGWMRGERSATARIDGWLRFADGRPPDTDALPLMCDVLPPAVFAALETGWVPTLELTVHVRAVPAPGWLQGQVETRFLIDGTLDEDCELWDSDGRLVAMSRQLARLLPPPAG